MHQLMAWIILSIATLIAIHIHRWRTRRPPVRGSTVGLVLVLCYLVVAVFAFATRSSQPCQKRQSDWLINGGEMTSACR